MIEQHATQKYLEDNMVVFFTEHLFASIPQLADNACYFFDIEYRSQSVQYQMTYVKLV